jgi:hypothetical protein
MKEEEMMLLLEKGESEYLDWKENFPPGLIKGSKNSIWDSGRAELLKDIVSLANSPCQTTAYLIYGVKDLKTRRGIKGISKSFDDADFQQWAKNTFDPSPKFQYTEINWPPSEKIGVFEIEKTLDYPHVVKKDIGKILYRGQVWFRTGSQNEVALRSDLEKMFKGETPCRFMRLDDPAIRKVAKHYKDLGREPCFPMLMKKESLLNQGYEVAPWPGKRQEIWVGDGDKNTHILLLKPKEGK